MSLSTALSNALSGLNASSVQAEVIANNVANAQTANYTRRTAELGATTLGAQGDGVRVTNIALAENTAAVGSRRIADAELGAGQVALDGLAQVGAALGTPGSGTALAGLAADFELALAAAANDPAADTRLTVAVDAAGDYAAAIVTLSGGIQAQRADADAGIARQVDLVNRNLERIEDLNTEILRQSVQGGDTAALRDERKAMIDRISEVAPLRVVERENGQVALYTANGATLLDGQATQLDFTPKSTVTQDMTLASGALSGLTLNGRPVTVGAPDGSGAMDGGALGALFVQRDSTLPGIADQLDALAEDLVLRFQAPGIDRTSGPGDAGLFTDDGALYAPADREGIARRLELNAAVDPAQGGQAWRLRDGQNAVAPGDVGGGAVLVALHDAALMRRAPDPALGVTGAGSISDFAAGLTSSVATRQTMAEDDVGYLSALNTSLRDAELQISGVDTDDELQRLLLVEQAYAANARVMQTVDDLIRRLLEI